MTDRLQLFSVETNVSKTKLGVLVCSHQGTRWEKSVKVHVLFGSSQNCFQGSLETLGSLLPVMKNASCLKLDLPDDITPLPPTGPLINEFQGFTDYF